VLVLLDRDGVINEDRADFVKSPNELVFIEAALQTIADLKAARHIVAIVTNQSCIGRGLITMDTLDAIHGKLHQALASKGTAIDHIFIAPDAPWAATPMRKPGPGMILAALSKFRERPENTVFIGDSMTDLQAAKAASVHRILVQTGKGLKTQATGIGADLLPVSIARDLPEAASYIANGRL